MEYVDFLYEEKAIKPPEKGIYCTDCTELYPEKVKSVDRYFFKLIEEFMEKEGR